MIVGFTGTQRGMTDPQRVAVRQILEKISSKISRILHGGCVGADADFHGLCGELLLRPIEVYPSNIPGKRADVIGDENFPPLPPLKRNKIIVKQCHLLIATPKEPREILRSGTWATIRFARKVGKRTNVVWPDGKTVEVGHEAR